MTDTEIIEALAVKVMGWHKSAGHNYWLLVPNDLVAYIVSMNSHDNWNPLTDPADSKQVREKLAERYDGVAMTAMNHKGKRIYAVTVYNLGPDGRPRQQPETRAATEERAVALCALATVGIKP